MSHSFHSFLFGITENRGIIIQNYSRYRKNPLNNFVDLFPLGRDEFNEIY